MKKHQQEENIVKDEKQLIDTFDFYYYGFRLEALAQKIKVKNFKPKKIESVY